MRRHWMEWLFVPLFLLPPAGVAGFCLVCRSAYFAELDAGRRQGPAAFYGGPIPASDADLAARFRSAEGLDDRRDSGFEVHIPGGVPRIRVRFPRSKGAPRIWRFSMRFPGSLPPRALARREVRLALQTGRAPVTLPEVDPAARAFAGLLQKPALEPLAAAPLPVATKLFLLDRGHPQARELRRMLALVRDWLPPLERWPGIYRHPGTGSVLLCAGEATPPVIAPDPSKPRIWRRRTMGNLRLLVGDAIAEGPNELWRGRLERPLAATWVLEAVHGGRWWRDARFRRWIAPAGLAGFAFLLIPLLLAIALRRRRALDKARLRFLTEIAHDLRTPLTAVRLHAEMLTTGRAPEQKRAGYLETVARESVRLSGLLGNLLDFSRLERGARSFAPEKVAVAEAAAQAACDFQALFPERRDDITWSGPEDLRARADRTALGRCLANLLDNAGKFTPLRTPIEIRWRAKEGKVRIEVSDRGGGIPPAEAKRIFQRYRRGAASRQNGIPGTGLGLSLVRELMRGMEGEISLAGSGQGAVFVLELPEAGDG